MGLEELQEKMLREQQAEKPFERTEDIAQHLFGVDNYPGRSVNKDSTRANNNPTELQAVRGSARIINRLELGEKLFGWNFNNIIEFFEGNRAITDVTGRGKNGMMSYLAKSDINIQQAEQMIIQGQDYSEEAELSAREKIQTKIPFLKKKEL